MDGRATRREADRASDPASGVSTVPRGTATGRVARSGAESPLRARVPAGPAVRAAPLATADRLVLTNRLLDASCVLRRRARGVVPVGACREALPQADRIAALLVASDGIRLTDGSGATLVAFGWNEETGLASVPTSAVPEAGALALLPVASDVR